MWDPQFVTPPPPQMVALSPFKPIPNSNTNPRRLSARMTKPKPNPAQGLAWVSLQGRLVGADEATSAKVIGGGLTPHQALAWELLTPIHRVLIVAVVAAAVANSKNNKQILKLQSCVHLRDQILTSMQQKLEDLCEQVNCIKDQPQAVSYPSPTNSADCSFSDSVSNDCWLCDQHRTLMIDLSVNYHMEAASGNEICRRNMSISNEAEQEERRMSDMSDWASSVTTAADLQKTEELEDIIRRKNTIITKLKKDILVLEQKVMNLTRARRRSFPGPITEPKQLPTMTDNVLYDMDSSTSPSSSDSDCCSKKKNAQIVKSVVQTTLDKLVETKLPGVNISKRTQKSRPVSPLKEISMNQRQHSVASPRSMQMFSSAGTRSSRRRSQNGFKEMGIEKRWV